MTNRSIIPCCEEIQNHKILKLEVGQALCNFLGCPVTKTKAVGCIIVKTIRPYNGYICTTVSFSIIDGQRSGKDEV